MTTPTKRFALPDDTTPFNEDERQKECIESIDERWEATVRFREDETIVAEKKLSEALQKNHALNQRIKSLEDQIQKLEKNEN